MSKRIGTVEVLCHRVYQTESGDMTVAPGVYPVLQRPGGYVSMMLEGRRSERTLASTDRIGDGLFVLHPGCDVPSGDLVTFPQGYWSPQAFQKLLADPVATPGPMQRLRFNMLCDTS